MAKTIRQPRRYWKPWEEEMLRLNYADSHNSDLAQVFGCTPERVAAKASAMGLKKSREYLAAEARKHTLKPGHPSHAYRFQRGAAPANKGVKHPPGWAPGRMREGQFKAGHKPHTWVPVGSYRIVKNKSGGEQLERKVNDMPGPTCVRWHPVHRLVWEAAHGPVPDGHIVVFKPGRRSTELEHITLDAVECITRVELMRRNTIHHLPPEFAEVARLKAVLHRTINTKLRKDGRADQALPENA